MSKDIVLLLEWLERDVKKNSNLIDCEDGSAMFVSTVAVKNSINRVRRALQCEQYKEKLLTQIKKEAEYWSKGDE